MFHSITYQCLKVNKSVFRLINHMFSGGFHAVISFYVLYSCMYAQSWLTLCDPLDCSPPGSSLHGIFQARILEWVSISFSRDSSQSRDQTHVSCVSWIAGSSLPPKPSGKYIDSVSQLFFLLLSVLIFLGLSFELLYVLQILLNVDPNCKGRTTNIVSKGHKGVPWQYINICSQAF